MDCSLSGSSVHGFFQARVLVWVAISFPRRSSRLRDWIRVSCIVGRGFYHLSHQQSHVSQHESRVLLYLVGMFRALNPGESISVALRKLLQGGRRGRQDIYKFATKGTGSLNIKYQVLLQVQTHSAHLTISQWIWETRCWGKEETLPRELSDQEDGRLAPLYNHLIGVWMPGSFTD